jgi:single-strand DNA-binding protein
MSVNKVILIGNLGKDPELRRTQTSNTSVCSFSLATSDRRKNPDGTWGDSTEWHNIVAFGNQAENCGKYLKKGQKVYIDGRLTTRKWQDQQGNNRYTTEIIANSVQFLGSRQNDMSVSDQGSDNFWDQTPNSGADVELMGQSNSGQAKKTVGSDISFDDDDIPF